MKQNHKRAWKKSAGEAAFQDVSFPEELQTREGHLRAVGDTEAVTKDIRSPHQCRLPASSTLLVSAIPFIPIPLCVSLSLRNPRVLCNSLTRRDTQRFREWKTPSWEDTVSPPQKILCWKGWRIPRHIRSNENARWFVFIFGQLYNTTENSKDSQLKSLTMYLMSARDPSGTPLRCQTAPFAYVTDYECW